MIKNLKILDNYINDQFAIDTEEVKDIYKLLKIENRELFDKLIEDVVTPRKKEYDSVILKSQDKKESLYHIMHYESQPMGYAARVLKATLDVHKVNYQKDEVSKSVYSRYCLEISLNNKPKSKNKKI